MNIACSDNRGIEALEEANLIPDAIYYNKPITVYERAKWHEAALLELKDVDVVFVDPNNGLLVKSVGKKSLRSVKYTFYEEVSDYINQRKSVLIYNHRCRKSEDQCFQDICENLSKHTGIPEDRILKITFPKCSVRDYLAVSFSTNHAKKIERAFLEMEQGIRGKLGVCRIRK